MQRYEKKVKKHSFSLEKVQKIKKKALWVKKKRDFSLLYGKKTLNLY